MKVKLFFIIFLLVIFSRNVDVLKAMEVSDTIVPDTGKIYTQILNCFKGLFGNVKGCKEYEDVRKKYFAFFSPKIIKKKDRELIWSKKDRFAATIDTGNNLITYRNMQFYNPDSPRKKLIKPGTAFQSICINGDFSDEKKIDCYFPFFHDLVNRIFKYQQLNSNIDQIIFSLNPTKVLYQLEIVLNNVIEDEIAMRGFLSNLFSRYLNKPAHYRKDIFDFLSLNVNVKDNYYK